MLAEWKGPSVGVVRSLSKLCQSLRQHPGVRAHFVTLDFQSRGCRQYSPEWVAQAIARIEGTASAQDRSEGAAAAEGSSKLGSLRLAIRRQISALRQRSGMLARRKALPWLRRGAASAGRLIKRLATAHFYGLIRSGRLESADRFHEMTIKVRGFGVQQYKALRGFGGSLLYLWRYLKARLQERHPLAPGQSGGGMAIEPGDIYLNLHFKLRAVEIELLSQLKAERGLKIVTTCHDTVPMKHPEFLVMPAVREDFAMHSFEMAHLADGILCVSEATRLDLEALYAWAEVPQPPKLVARQGSDFDAVPVDWTAMARDPSIGWLLSHRFCLAVGTLEPRKNTDLLYRLWDRLIERHGVERIPHLVIVGRPGWRTDDTYDVIQLNLRTRERIHLREKLFDPQLAALYRRAALLLYPSHAEGWGLPVVEAMNCGTPVLASDDPAVREAAQGLAAHLDPYDFAAWYEACERLLLQPGALDAFAAWQRSRYRPWRWPGFAAEVVAGLQSLPEHRP